MLKVQCLGAVGTVTGSKFLVTTSHTRILIDCGLFQGYKVLRKRNWSGLPTRDLDAVVLTHAHLDHSGYLPVLYREGMRVPVYCHPATKELLALLLPDSGKLQEEDAHFLNRHKLSRHDPALPLYTREDALETLKQIETVEFEQSFSIGDLNIRLQPAGHILGACSIIIEYGKRRLVFSGDLGRPDDVVMYPPAPLPDCDALFIESTYGDHLHTPGDPWEQLADVVNTTVGRGGIVAIPSFAVGRAQELQYMLARLMRENRIPELPIFLDSPMAIKASHLYGQYHALHRLSPEDCRHIDKVVTEVQSVAQSKSLAAQKYPHIIIAGSGMVTGGRILHHLKHVLVNHANTLLLAGFQASGTRGAHLAEGAERVRIHGQYYPVKARIQQLDSLSAHADQSQLLAWLEGCARPPRQVYVVHGEPEASDQLRQLIEERFECDADTPDYQEWLTIFES